MTDINKIKFEVYREVARMAFDGKLKECADEIPYNIIPGNLPHHRCRAAILKILFKYFRRPVRAVRSTGSV